jgi:leucyl aminopeptidase
MSLSITTSTLKPAAANVDLLVIPLTSELRLGKFFSESVRRHLGVGIRKLEFTGAWGSAEVFLAPKSLKAPFVAFVGLGDGQAAPEVLAEGMRRGMGKVIHDARRHMLHSAAVVLLDASPVADVAAAATESVLLSSYRFTNFSSKQRSAQEGRALRKLNFLVSKEVLQIVRDAVETAETINNGILLARQLVNQPASHMSPRVLMEEAQAISKRSNRISIQIFDREQAREEGFTAFLAVAQGSKEEPYVIHLTYKPKAAATKKLFVIGKGITFDSGGLSLKPANAMETMKIDMAGAAAVLGLFSLLEKIQPDVEIHGLIAACENMPSGSAYRPGDIVRAKNGKTIEVLNTDAEGRVTLADMLSYAVEHKPDMIVDLATLTGACMVALGETHAGLFSNSQQLSEQLMHAAREVGEGLVALPLPEEYRPTVESKVADVRNIATTNWGGAITAALFLQAFVDNVSWAHIDLAGPVFAERQLLPYFDYGATGYGVRTLARFVKNL